ncbi:MAG: hypothetical protein ABEJ31_05280 [Haloarculaceae archaeon]
MWGSRRNRDDAQVTCIACGRSVRRSDAREYDKHGDRWDRADKDFEYLCKRCHREECHQPRDGLERLLVDSGAGETDRETFLSTFQALLERRQDSPEGHES